ncbi:MAG: lamin tail domain-containing protein [Verrucomicrobiales bacterium]
MMALSSMDGTEVARFFMPEGPIAADTPALSGGDEKVFFDTGAIPASVLRAGTNVVAVEVHQVAPTNSDISFDLELTARTLVENAPAGVEIDRPLVLKTRAFDGEEWSALREATFSISSLKEGLAITEIFYHPGRDYGAATEFIELSNLGARTVSLDGVGFSSGILFNFTGSTVTQLEPGGRVIVVRDLAAFRTAFPEVPESLVAGEFADGTALSNGGERIALTGPVGESLIDFTYGTSAPWPDSADGEGYSLTLAEPVSAGSILPDPALAANWKASARPGGTPGTAEAAPSDLLAQFLGSALIIEPAPASGKVSISFIRNPDTVDLTFGFETSLDLGDWRSAALELSSETPLADGSTRLVYLWQEAENLFQYLRLRVSR